MRKNQEDDAPGKLRTLFRAVTAGWTKKPALEEDLEAALDEVTQAEFNNLRRIFKVFDVNNSDTIDVQELVAMMQCMGVSLNNAEAAELIGTLDNNDNGELDFEEFVMLMMRNKQLIGAAKRRAFEPEALMKASTRTSRFMPDAPWRWYWGLMLLGATGYLACTVPLRLVWAVQNAPDEFYAPAGLLFGDILVTIMLALDIAVCFNTAYVDRKNHLVTELGPIAAHYRQGWLVIDLLACIPLDIIFRGLEIRYGATVVSFLRLLRMTRISSIVTSSERNYVVNAAYIRFNFHIVPVTSLLLWCMSWVHWFAIIAMLLEVGVEDDESFTVSACSLAHPGPPNYLECLYWVSYTLATVGNGDVYVHGVAQQAFAMVLFLMSLLINGVIVAKMAELFRDKSIKEETQQKMRETLALLQHFGIPNPLQQNILGFQHHVLRHSLSESFASVIAGLPDCLRDQVALYMRISYVSNVPMFHTASMECKVSLAQRLKSVVVPQDEFIIVVGEEGDCMFFLNHGFAQVLRRDGTHVHLFQPGDFFGEVAILGDGVKRMASVRAVTYCDLFSLSKDDFRDILQRFPKLKMEVVAEGQKRMQQEKGSTPGPFQGAPSEESSAEEDEAPMDESGQKSARQEPDDIQRLMVEMRGMKHDIQTMLYHKHQLSPRSPPARLALDDVLGSPVTSPGRDQALSSGIGGGGRLLASLSDAWEEGNTLFEAQMHRLAEKQRHATAGQVETLTNAVEQLTAKMELGRSHQAGRESRGSTRYFGGAAPGLSSGMSEFSNLRMFGS
eukprot:NODE_319_length_2685_cov_119.085870_g295_i1.p1 GENE.NODE_319_length_2685_cov_119.085870_g295_i1~~NODE_319_length_2685_cov_119.085870_g295_i1.p1  ORF type:complete len:784 (+),score=164.78 NODE_319_length_2685_cov_119.085870_g295_i1:143-2494(+)